MIGKVYVFLTFVLISLSPSQVFAKYYGSTETPICIETYGHLGKTFQDNNESSDKKIKCHVYGKGLDQHNEFDYFEARYYDSVTGTWVSVDPALDDYLPVPGNKQNLPGKDGVYNTKNLNSYSYGHLNPIKYVDPDGRTVDDPNNFNKFKRPLGPPIKEGRNYVKPLQNALNKFFSKIKNAFSRGPKVNNKIQELGHNLGHNFKYHKRISQRGLQDPKAHNYPYSFDKKILGTKPIKQSDGSLLYRMKGNLNKTEGMFEIAVNPNTKTIFHRTFRKITK